MKSTHIVRERASRRGLEKYVYREGKSVIACEARTTESLYCSGEYAPRSAIARAGADCFVDTKLVFLRTVEIDRMDAGMSPGKKRNTQLS